MSKIDIGRWAEIPAKNQELKESRLEAFLKWLKVKVLCRNQYFLTASSCYPHYRTASRIQRYYDAQS